jgi:HAD superfamily hydrolase (TIGR01549 family)
MHNTQIKAVLFDLGETLLDFGRIKPAEVFAAGAKSSYDYLRRLNQPVGGFKSYFWRNLLNLRMQRWISWFKRRDFDALALLKRVGAKNGLTLTAEHWETLAWLWYEPLSRIGRIEPDTKETLTMLKDNGLKLGIVSNTFVHGTSLEKHLKQLGILDFFTVRLYSYEFAFRKPDIRIFRMAAERIGQAPQNILYVGDRIDKDIKPAIKSGMSAVLKAAYTNSGRKLPPGVPRITRISELPALIEKINTAAPAN